jgi:hypothetical protein
MRLPILTFVLVLLAASASPVLAFDGCSAADLSGDGQVDFLDLSQITSGAIPLARRDLDGSGLVDTPDVLMAFGFIFRVCTGCTADLDGSGGVDAADRALLEAAYGRDCRLDLDRNGTVDVENDVDIWIYHFQHLPNPASARADFDGNGIVNFADLSALTSTIGNNCRVDLNADGKVDTNDLWALLASWGPCP